jgi:hypothetical protein
MRPTAKGVVMRWMRRAALFAATLFAGTALAADTADYWCIYAGPDYADFMFINLSKTGALRDGTHVAETLEVAEGDYAAKVGWSQRVVVLAYDCAVNRFAVMYIKSVGSDGAVITDQRVANPTWAVAPPQTTASDDLAFLCAAPATWPTRTDYAHLGPGVSPVGFAERTYRVHSFLDHAAP